MNHIQINKLGQSRSNIILYLEARDCGNCFLFAAVRRFEYPYKTLVFLGEQIRFIGLDRWLF